MTKQTQRAAGTARTANTSTAQTHLISRDLAAKLAMQADTEQGDAVREHFLAMERTARAYKTELGAYEDSMREMDETLKELCEVAAMDDVEAGIIPKEAQAGAAEVKEERIKALTGWIVTGKATNYLLETFGKGHGVRDVLEGADFVHYQNCFNMIVCLFQAGITDEEELDALVSPSFSHSVDITKYLDEV